MRSISFLTSVQVIIINLRCTVDVEHLLAMRHSACVKAVSDSTRLIIRGRYKIMWTLVFFVTHHGKVIVLGHQVWMTDFLNDCRTFYEVYFGNWCEGRHRRGMRWWLRHLLPVKTYFARFLIGNRRGFMDGTFGALRAPSW